MRLGVGLDCSTCSILRIGCMAERPSDGDRIRHALQDLQNPVNRFELKITGPCFSWLFGSSGCIVWMRSFENKNPEREPRWEVGRFMHVCICSHFFLSPARPGPSRLAAGTSSALLWCPRHHGIGLQHLLHSPHRMHGRKAIRWRSHSPRTARSSEPCEQVRVKNHWPMFFLALWKFWMYSLDA